MKYSFILISFCITALFISCQKEAQEPELKAMYSFSVKGPEVSFNNLSGYFDEFVWDFGDGNTSSDLKPIHIYKEKGPYVVKLTGKKGTHTDTFIDTVVAESPTITIDGQFDDWDYIQEYTWKNADDAPGVLLAMKSFYSATHLFFLVEGTSEMKFQPYNMVFDTDANPGTGYAGLEWFPQGGGFEYKQQGDMVMNTDANRPWVGWVDLDKYPGPPDDYSTTKVGIPDAYLIASPIKNINGKYSIEFSILKQPFGALPKEIRVGIRHLSPGWQGNGWLPYQPGTTLEGMIPIRTRD